jgi:hypothetical protein
LAEYFVPPPTRPPSLGLGHTIVQLP